MTHHEATVSATPAKVVAPPAETSPRSFRIYVQDDALRQHYQQNIQKLLITARSLDDSSTSSRLARKALKYRKVLDRIEGVDVTASAFDASKFLGIDWCPAAPTQTKSRAHSQ